MFNSLRSGIEEWFKRRKRKRNAQEEYQGYEYVMKAIYRGIPIEEVKQEIQYRIYFSRGSGHFEKGMLRFLENKKAMDLVFQAFQERRNYEYE